MEGLSAAVRAAGGGAQMTPGELRALTAASAVASDWAQLLAPPWREDRKLA